MPKKLTQEEAVKRSLTIGCQLIGEYINSGVKTEFKCKCGKSFHRTPNDVWKRKSVLCRDCGNKWQKPQLGEVLGKLTIIKIIQGNSFGFRVIGRCVCGGTWSGFYSHLTRSDGKAPQTCGKCLHPNLGDKFGKLTVQEIFPGASCGCRVRCNCDCGGSWTGKFHQLKDGMTKSCGCLKSNGEYIVKKWLAKHNITNQQQKRFSGCRYKRSLPFDFYIPNKKMCIEYHGEQHYRSVNFRGISDEQAEQSHYSTVRADIIKKLYCQNNNLTYLEIPYWKIEEIDQILSEELL